MARRRQEPEIAPSIPAWDELERLHVVRNVGRLLNRRWQLAIGWQAGADPAAFTSEHSLCAQVHSGCTAGMAESLTADRGAVASRCFAGLTHLVAPVTVDGQVVGAMVSGGFLRESSHQRDLAAIDRRVREADGDDESYRQARASVAILQTSDEAFVSELLVATAEDVASYIDSRPIEVESEGKGRTRFDSIIGAAPKMQELYNLLDRVVGSDSTILVQGENGTGKELVARAIHRLSGRRKAPFVVQNCSAFNDNLLDSELFGHKRGAFTGAVVDKEGLFQVADGGTFFLDEIGDMSPALQVKVLRVLQEGTFTPVGDTVERKVDVRIVAATNRDLKAMIETGEFREDLYYRINVINLVLPPLRERDGDVERLARAFLTRHAQAGKRKSLSSEATSRLRSYAWPGNVRELENEIERAVVLSGRRPTIKPEDFSERVQQAQDAPSPGPELESLPLPVALRTLERRMILAALREHSWNKTRAAAALEISRRNLIRLVQKYELEALRQR